MGVKIKDIEVFQVAWAPDEMPATHSAWVYIHAEDGLSGIGEASPMPGGLASLGSIARHGRAVYITEPSIGGGARQHANGRCQNVGRKRDAGQAERAVQQVEGEERHELVDINRVTWAEDIRGGDTDEPTGVISSAARMALATAVGGSTLFREANAHRPT